MFDEPSIIINGKAMTTGQSMTIRVAINSFLSDLASKGGDALGDDTHGHEMTRLYKKQLHSIIQEMNKQEPKNETD